MYAISVDTIFSHNAFVEQLGGLPFPLLSDFERRAVEAFGVRRDDVPGYRGMPQRSVFIVDRSGIIRWAWERSDTQPMPDYDQLVAEACRIAGS